MTEADEEGQPSLTTMVSMGLIRNETKEAVVIGGVVDDEEEPKYRCNQREASDSGVGEFIKMSNRGTHASIFACSSDSTNRGKINCGAFANWGSIKTVRFKILIVSKQSFKSCTERHIVSCSRAEFI